LAGELKGWASVRFARRKVTRIEDLIVMNRCGNLNLVGIDTIVRVKREFARDELRVQAWRIGSQLHK
jgi:hypothetical protein